jgi:hypothetical protein
VITSKVRPAEKEKGNELTLAEVYRLARADAKEGETERPASSPLGFGN